VCYGKSGDSKEAIRKKFIELCEDKTHPMIRRACACALGDFSGELD